MSVIVDELLRIYRRDGKLHPEQVVAEAASPRSPLHSAFTWEDDVAAHRWRLEEARSLIRRPEITVVISEQRHKVRAFVSIDGDSGYVSTADALNDSTLSEVLFVQLHRDVENLVARYRAFEQAAPVVRTMEEWLAQVPTPKRRGRRR